MTNPISIRTLALTDPTRRNWQNTDARPLVTNVWYPADAAASETNILIGAPDAPIFFGGRAAWDAGVAESPEQFPH